MFGTWSLCFACGVTHAGLYDGRRKSRNYVSDMMRVFIHMGLLSCIVAFTMAVLVSPGCSCKTQKIRIRTVLVYVSRRSHWTVLYRCTRSGHRKILYEFDDGGTQC
ncbi:hypothetical protein EDB19DRAFT_1726727 [Suillus lakei]|nr:hypothetical protein EDB19DRAFT_1726727 [Suillus lakei]